jgi:hypothetical protein
MNNDLIKEFAEQAGLAYKMSNGMYWIDAGEVDIHLEHFAELVRQDEREACAKLCDDAGYAHEVMQGSELAFELAAEIRGRTE